MHEKKNTVIYPETILKNTVIYIFGHTTQHLQDLFLLKRYL